MIRIEVKIIKELPFGSNDNQRQAREELIRLSKTFFPLGILTSDENEGYKRTASWTGSLEEFIRLLEIRESFGKEYEPIELMEAYAEIMAKAG